MKPYWVETDNPLRLAIVPRPRGGDWLEDDLDQMKRAGIDVLVSMLQVDEAAELGLSSEAELCEARGIVFRSFPIPDRETPPSTASFSRMQRRCPLQSLNRAFLFALGRIAYRRRIRTG
jgi:hypothetical protein